MNFAPLPPFYPFCRYPAAVGIIIAGHSSGDDLATNQKIHH
jgi:hypothetical protein